jgi:hypothetical protein
MTDSCTFPIVAATGIASARTTVGAVEKPRCDKGLQQDVTSQPPQETASGVRRERRRASHSGTNSNAPLWNGPRLQAAFVAQVLGQVLAPQSSDPRLALAAYQRDDVRRLQRRLLDSEV